MTFQFQIGAIGSFGVVVGQFGINRFNSRLVRLVARSQTGITRLLSSFNSRLVRLVDRNPDYPETFTTSFQFQIGAIGSAVRFCPKCTFKLFQFQIGAIGSQFSAVYPMPGMCFNSRLVRLVEYGNIGTSNIAHVSIPDWCDW